MPSLDNASGAGVIISLAFLVLGHFVFPKSQWQRRSIILMIVSALVGAIGLLAPGPVGPVIAAVGGGGFLAQAAVWFIVIFLL